ncbi:MULTISPECIES: 3'-5' exonuclease [Nocardioides]|uniref:Exonuclease domain-containing protein n=1 Tax=Nocardioides vastitatis TaxID=2568655 RepID=A0ABW0ZH18_9ACTN|nr:3'-5' exonuclease [Nocardioides sp.]
MRSGAEHSGPYAVIDFETTGLSARRDRIVEVAIARVDASGRIEDEFATLINPEGRDVGPTFIHGITNAQVERAPTFADVAPELLCRLSGAVVVAHNATFEEAFLAAELKRAGLEVPRLPALCTLWLGRQTFTTPNYKLGTLARAAGVPLVDKHAALGDVRAVCALLPQMTRQLRTPVLFSCVPMSWTSRNAQPLPLVTRAVALRKGSDGWMHSLMARLPVTGIAPHSASAEAYLDALTEVLSDGKITGEEAKVLAYLAGSAGMGGEQVLDSTSASWIAFRLPRSTMTFSPPPKSANSSPQPRL